MNRISIIIPTLLCPPTLAEYVGRLAKYKRVCEVIIVINGDQRVLKKAENSTIKVIALGKNKGFTGACNAGARAATGNYLLFLNDDCELDEENFTKLVEFLDQNSEMAATQPIVYKKSTPYPLHPTPSKEIENIGFTVDTRIGKAVAVQDLQILPVPTMSGKQVQNDTNPTPYTLQPTTFLYGLSGTCLLIHKEIFEKVGMWDESFHSYLEDVDLALRLRKFGFKFAPCLDAAVTHAHMGTSSRMGIYKPMQDMKNWWRLIFKYPEIFVHFGNLIPLLLERARNLNGLLKALVHIRP